MPNLPERRSSAPLSRTSAGRPTSLSDLLVARQTGRALTRLEADTALRLADVQAEGIVQTEKARELDNLAREAMTGQAMLAKWRDTLAGPDPMLQDELRRFSDMAALGKSEVMADTVATYCRESRGGR